MYSWIWRKLPFGLWGKLSGSLILISIAVALLWYVVFPWAEPILPFDDVQVGDPDYYGDPGPTPTDGHELNYPTADPSPSQNR